MKIYLVSRVAFDARQANLKVANTLREAGHSVFVPHTASYNENDSQDSTDEDIYRQDMAEMLAADAAVIVGRIGVDCAFEVGWFQNQGIPTFWINPPPDRSPMLFLVPKSKSKGAMLKFLNDIGNPHSLVGAK